MDVRQALKALQAMAFAPSFTGKPSFSGQPLTDMQPSFSGAPSSNFEPYRGGPINTSAPAQTMSSPNPNFSAMQMVRQSMYPQQQYQQQSYQQPRYANNTSQDYQGMDY